MDEIGWVYEIHKLKTPSYNYDPHEHPDMWIFLSVVLGLPFLIPRLHFSSIYQYCLSNWHTGKPFFVTWLLLKHQSCGVYLPWLFMWSAIIIEADIHLYWFIWSVQTKAHKCIGHISCFKAAFFLILRVHVGLSISIASIKLTSWDPGTQKLGNIPTATFYVAYNINWSRHVSIGLYDVCKQSFTDVVVMSRCLGLQKQKTFWYWSHNIQDDLGPFVSPGAMDPGVAGPSEAHDINRF